MNSHRREPSFSSHSFSSQPPVEQTKAVRAIRTPFGTRVMKTITCERCQKSDHISFIPKDGRPILCRTCAEEVHNVIDEPVTRWREWLAPCVKCGKQIPTFAEQKRKEHDAPTQTAPRLCQECELGEQSQRRKDAKRPIGMHPLVVKKKKP